MNAFHRFLALGILAALTVAAPRSLHAATLTAPPTVLFGKVIHIGQGSSYQVYEGALTLELIRIDDPDHVIQLQTELDRIGPAGEISYRLEIPVKHQPAADELSGSLAAGFLEAGYSFRSLTIDGEPAVPLDPGQARLNTSLANPAGEHRLDLEVTLPQTDSDLDGMPDWWEQQYGLNVHLAADAAADPDGDGLDSLGEYHAGTDPNLANTGPLIQTTNLEVPAGGTGGFHVGIVDLDTAPSKLDLTFNTIPSGLTLWLEDAPITEGDTIIYETVLAGLVGIDVDDDFESGVLALTVQEQATNGVAVAAALRIDAFSPATVALVEPSIWLDAASVSGTGTVTEWADRSGENRDAYQPITDLRPAREGGSQAGIAFSGGHFLFVDDRELDTDSFTAFVAFDLDTLGDHQTLFNSGALEVSIGGTSQPGFAHSLKVTGAGRQMRGPVVAAGALQQWTLGGGADATFLSRGDGAYVASRDVPNEALNPSSFTTIGARRPIDAALAVDFLEGAVREVLIYNVELQPAVRARNEDYQHSRWGSRLVWDARRQTVPVHVTGHPTRANALTGGWGSDDLTGGHEEDILRGGPGNDRLTGKGGADRFQFFTGHGDDLVSDFNPDEGDLLDFTGIFGAQAGLPSDFVRFRQVIVRLPDALPRVDTVIELDYDGTANGWTVNQTITLEDRAHGNHNLARLVGENALVLGGPRFETAIEVTSPANEILENGLPQPVTLTRTGNLDAALDVAVSLTGEAGVGVDFLVPGGDTNAPVQIVRFERQQTEALLNIVPLVDTESEAENIVVTLLADPHVTSGHEVPLTIPIADIPLFTIETHQHAEALTDGRRGLAVVRRGGAGLEEAAELDVASSGSLFAGIEYSVSPGTVFFAPGVEEVEIAILPGNLEANGDEVDYIDLRLARDPTTQAIIGPDTARVLFLPSDIAQAPSFQAWSESNLPGADFPDLATEDQDLDGIANLLEYILGTSPTVADPAGTGDVSIALVDGRLELSLTTQAGWSGAELGVISTTDLATWTEITSEFSVTYRQIGSDRILQTFVSQQPITSLPARRFFRFSAAQISADLK